MENKISYLQDEGIIIGREEELNEFDHLLDNVKSGEGYAVFIAGEPGVGKSRMVSEIQQMASEKGFKALKGTCIEGDTQPYLPFQQIWKASDTLETLSFMLHEDDLLKKRENLETYRNYRGVAFYETTEQLRNAVSDDPHLMIIEDIHWANKATLNLFHYLTDRLRDIPLVFVATYQPGEAFPGSSLTEMKQEMSRKNLFAEVELYPLTFEDTHKLVTKITGQDNIPLDFVEILYEKTQGNPLLIRESIIQMIDASVISLEENKFPEDEDKFFIPGLIQDVVERRVFRLDDKARETLQMGSVIGKNVPFELLKNASELGEFELLDEIDKLLKCRLWTEDPIEDKFLFSHEVIHKSVYEGIGKWLEKKRLHLMVAESIEDVHEKEIEEKYSQLAAHYEKAEDYQTSLEYHLKAARRAKKMCAFEDAIWIYKKAMELIFWMPENKENRRNILKEMADTYMMIGDYDKSLECLYKVLNAASNFKEEQKTYIKIIGMWQENGEDKKALELIEKRLPLETKKSLEKCEFLGKKGWSLMQMGRHEEAAESFEKEKRVAEEIEDEDHIAQAYHDLGSINLKRRRLSEALKNLEKAKEIRERSGCKMELARTLNNIAGVYTYKGELDKALQEYEECLNLYDEIGERLHRGGVHNNIGMIYLKKGEIRRALKHLHIGYDRAKQMDNQFIMCHTLVNIGRAHMEKKEFEKALDFLKEGLDLSEKTNYLDRMIEAERFLTITNLHKGDIEQAKAHLKRLIETSSDRDIPREKGLIKYLKGAVFRNEGSVEKAADFFEESINIFDDINSVELKGLCLYEFGSMLKENGDVKKGDEIINKAMSYFEEKGMKLWAHRCRSLLKKER